MNLSDKSESDFNNEADTQVFEKKSENSHDWLAKLLLSVVIVSVMFFGVYSMLLAPGSSSNTAVVAPASIDKLQVGDVVTIRGEVQPGGRNGCVVDGVCSTIVDGYEIIINGGDGWGEGPVGIVADHVIGDKVEVHGELESEFVVTLYGDDSYYLKLVADTDPAVVNSN